MSDASQSRRKPRIEVHPRQQVQVVSKCSKSSRGIVVAAGIGLPPEEKDAIFSKTRRLAPKFVSKIQIERKF